MSEHRKTCPICDGTGKREDPLTDNDVLSMRVCGNCGGSGVTSYESEEAEILKTAGGKGPVENDDDKIEIPEGWKLVGFVGVDSGQVIICDPCYLPERRPALEQMCGRHEAEWIDGSDGAGDEDLHAPKFAGEFSYRGVCSTTIHFGAGQLYYRMGHAGAGVASNTMIGDGTYPVFAQISPKGEIHGLIIRFDIAKMDFDHDGIKYDVPKKRTEQIERAEAIAARRQQAYNKIKGWAEAAAERAEAPLKKHEGGEK